MATSDKVDVYLDYKSPYAWLAYLELSELERAGRLSIAWHLWHLDIEDAYERPEKRSREQQAKVKYLYFNVRRQAKSRGLNLKIRGPRKLFNSTLAAIGGHFARQHGCFDAYTRRCYERFFAGDFDIEDEAAIAGLLGEIGVPSGSFSAYRQGPGADAFAADMQKAADDGVFGVPFMVFQKEPFWGNELISALLERYQAAP